MQRPRRILFRIATYAMLVLGVALLLVSAFYASSFLSIVGLAILFWACILLYITPVKHVPLTLLQASADASMGNIERVITELNLTEKAIYLPPKNLKNIDSSLVFIPVPPNATGFRDSPNIVDLISETPQVIPPESVGTMTSLEPVSETLPTEPVSKESAIVLPPPEVSPEKPEPVVVMSPDESLPMLTPEGLALTMSADNEPSEETLETPTPKLSMSGDSVAEKPANVLQLPEQAPIETKAISKTFKVTLLPTEKSLDASLRIVPQTQETEQPPKVTPKESPPPVVSQSPVIDQTPPEKPLVPTPEAPTPVQPKPELVNGNRLVFLLKAEQPGLAAKKLVFVFDLPDAHLSLVEKPLESSFPPLSQEPLDALPEPEEKPEKPSVVPPEVSKAVTTPAVEPVSELPKPLLETPKPPEPPKAQPETSTPQITPQAAESPPKLTEAPEEQSQPSKAKLPMNLQLDSEVEMSLLLELLNKEKDILTAIQSQECWNCKSTEKAVVNYNSGIGNKGEVKLVCKKCGAILTFNYKNT